jgi:DNA-directed RNA polymerase sigma subunit (sigma70/sigma32)
MNKSIETFQYLRKNISHDDLIWLLEQLRMKYQKHYQVVWHRSIGKKFKEIGKDLGVTPERTRQMEFKGLGYLRRSLSKKESVL